MPNQTCDIAIVGGGVNGCGIARDGAGRGLSVYLCEQGRRHELNLVAERDRFARPMM